MNNSWNIFKIWKSVIEISFHEKGLSVPGVANPSHQKHLYRAHTHAHTRTVPMYIVGINWVSPEYLTNTWSWIWSHHYFLFLLIYPNHRTFTGWEIMKLYHLSVEQCGNHNSTSSPWCSDPSGWEPWSLQSCQPFIQSWLCINSAMNLAVSEARFKMFSTILL